MGSVMAYKVAPGDPVSWYALSTVSSLPFCRCSAATYDGSSAIPRPAAAISPRKP
ncbi:hypothetical protein D3C72_2423030 [compost metagenome]